MINTEHPLLGNHKASSEWYTPSFIWQRIFNTFQTTAIFDPCPINGTGGFDKDWDSEFIYINPPTSTISDAKKTVKTRDWAEKALKNFEDKPHTSTIYAAFSESVLWQVPELMTHPIVFVRKRIKWDSNKPSSDKPDAPRNYNAFILLSHEPEILERFEINFGDLGFIGRMVNIKTKREGDYYKVTATKEHCDSIVKSDYI